MESNKLAYINWDFSSLPSPISTQAMDLLNRMLEIHQDDRISLSDIKQHPWMNHTDNPSLKVFPPRKGRFSSPAYKTIIQSNTCFEEMFTMKTPLITGSTDMGVQDLSEL